MDKELAQTIAQQQSVALDALTDCEAAVGRFYDAVAARFPEHRNFWGTLANEERGHEKAFGVLKAYLIRNETFLTGLEGHGLSDTQLTIAIVEKERELVSGDEYALEDAIRAGLMIECALTEAAFFCRASCQDTEVKSLLREFARHNHDHYDRIEAFAKTVRARG